MEKNKLRELVEQARMGNRMAMSSLVAEYRPHILGTCRSVICDEASAQSITNQVFDSAYERLSELKQPEDFLPWVTRIAKDKCGAVQLRQNTSPAKAGTTALDRTDGKDSLAVPGQAGGLQTAAQPGELAPVSASGKKKKAWIAVASVAAALVLLAGTAAILFTRGNPSAGKETGLPGWLDTQSTDLDTADAYEEFFESTYDVNEDMLILCDVTADGSGEMLVLDRHNSDESRLNIYTLLADGTVQRIYDMDKAGSMEAQYVIGLCEYEGKQCIYELQVDGWTGDSAYTESIFCLDSGGNRIVLEKWEGSMSEPGPMMGEFNFSRYEEIRDIVKWSYAVFEEE